MPKVWTAWDLKGLGTGRILTKWVKQA